MFIVKSVFWYFIYATCSLFFYLLLWEKFSQTVFKTFRRHTGKGEDYPPLPHIESPACNIISLMVYCLLSMSLFLSQLFFLMIDYFVFMFFFWRDHKILWSLYIHSISLGSTFILHLFSRNHHEESYFLRILLSMILILFIRIGLSTTCSFSIHFCWLQIVLIYKLI